MNLQKLTDQFLLEQTRKLVAEERRITTELLHHLREVDRRRCFADLGFGSLFAYLVEGLGYSESAAQRRISAMRLLKEIPELEEKLRTGAISLSVAAQAQQLFRQEAKLEKPLTPDAKREILSSLEGKSTREAEKALLPHSSLPASLIPDRVRALSESASEVRFVASPELLDDLERLRGLLAHSHPQLSLGELVQLLAKLALAKLDPAREPKTRQKETVAAPEVKSRLPEPEICLIAPATNPIPARTRFIPAPLRRQIWQRDGGCCAFVDPVTKRTCGSRHALQVDHLTPVALGGKSTPPNLRLLCFQHNQRAAIRIFGRRRMERYRN